MEVTREVILDLLPLYSAGEASTQTQTLVEEYLKNDPDLAQLAKQWKGRMPGPPPASINPDAHALAYREAKRKMAMKSVLTAALITAGIIALTALIGLLFVFPVAP